MKERITVSVDKKFLDWLDRRVQDRTFANRSHGFEFLIMRDDEETNHNNH